MIYIFFVLGLIIGSFLGVVNYRLKVAEDIIFKPSYCPKCKKAIRWYDNIPLLSFILLSGNCRSCRKKISLEYPAIELLTGLLFSLSYWYFFSTRIGSSGSFDFSEIAELAFLLFTVCYLIVIFFHDFDYKIIPSEIVYPAMGITLIYQIYRYFISSFSLFSLRNPLTSALLAAVIGGLFFLFQIWISKGKWIGGGDLKLGFLAGLILGWPKILFALFIAYAVGSVVSLALVAAKKKKWKSEIAFGPFLVTGIFVMMFLGEKIMFWAKRFLIVGGF